MKKFVLVLALCLLLCGCGEAHSPLNIYFRNLTSAGSDEYVFSVVFLEDKSVIDEHADILIKSDQPEMELEISEENGKTYYIYLQNLGEEYSLSKLLAEAKGKQNEYISLEKPVTQTYILTAEKRALLTIRAIRGKLEDGELKSTVRASNDFELEIEKV